MTRKAFEKRAIRDAEKALGVPPGWWGTYRDVRGPRGQRVRFKDTWWILTFHGGFVSGDVRRAFQISKGKNL